MNRVLATAGLHVIRPLGRFAVPWLIALSSFAVNLVIWSTANLGDLPDGGFTGGLASLYLSLLGVHVLAVTQVWPFTMSLGISRRTFTLATLLVALVEAIGYGVLLAGLVAVEDATGGWGVGLHFWAPGPLDVGPALQVAVSGIAALGCAALGVALGSLYMRWGPNGLWGLTVGLLLVAAVVAGAITRFTTWPAVDAWITDRSVLTLALGLPALVAVAAAGSGYLVLRRATP